MCWCGVHAGSACLAGECVLSDVVPGRDHAGTDGVSVVAPMGVSVVMLSCFGLSVWCACTDWETGSWHWAVCLFV